MKNLKNLLIQKILEKEPLTSDEFLNKIKEGKIVILFNKKRKKQIVPVAVGEGLYTKVNANIGKSPQFSSIKEELEKLKVAEEAGTDTIMDLSVGDDGDEVRSAIVEHSNVPIGSVPIYRCPTYAKKKNKYFINMTPDEILKCIEDELKSGIDYITVHAGLTFETLNRIKNEKRIGGIVSRGGILMVEWMEYNKKENPLYEFYDDLLDIAKKYSATLSLGDGLRPGAIADSTDGIQIQELIILGELVERARKKNVQAMVEGPGHVPLQHIEMNVKLEKRLCKGAPFYVLGPVVTDVAAGYDHIVGAIGGAFAAYHGVDFLCYLTPSEHLGLPLKEDVREGIIVSRIAAHIGDIAKGIKGADNWDKEISQYRANLNWEKLLTRVLDPVKANEIFNRYPVSKSNECTMCGKFCPVKKTKEVLD